MSVKALKAGVVLPIVILIVLVTAGLARTEQADSRTWEYKYLQLSSSQMHELEKTLNEQGFQRWELVSVVREHPGGTVHFYFKRAR